MKQKRSQASIEYLIIFGTLLIFLITIIYYFIQTVPEEIKVKQATDAVNKIARAVDTVHAVGPGSRRIIYVHVPRGTQYINLTTFTDGVGGEISLKMDYGGRPVTFLAITNANITGSIPPGKILYKLLIQTTGDRVVNITSQ
ncbi:hypothetical protein KY313_02220 [Candidatus Woesearchaeota archaeon]|jgi:uncharacterized protein (UPF0333 family)|nr:hypothetical protein [Candidatus Woesearchaeota archaeon]